jgi:hypothetical protein
LSAKMGQDETVDMHRGAGRNASCTFWPSAIARMHAVSSFDD